MEKSALLMLDECLSIWRDAPAMRHWLRQNDTKRIGTAARSKAVVVLRSCCRYAALQVEVFHAL